MYSFGPRGNQTPHRMGAVAARLSMDRLAEASTGFIALFPMPSRRPRATLSVDLHFSVSDCVGCKTRKSQFCPIKKAI